jgi:hypothetical protein
MFIEPEQYEHYCDFNYYHQFLMKEGTLISENVSVARLHPALLAWDRGSWHVYGQRCGLGSGICGMGWILLYLCWNAGAEQRG